MKYICLLLYLPIDSLYSYQQVKIYIRTMPGRRRQTGCICTCDRDTNDTVDLLGDDVTIYDEHQVIF